MSENLIVRVESGPQRGQSFELGALSGRWAIGADPRAELAIAGAGIAARHLELGRLKDGSIGVRVVPPARATLNGAPFESARWSVGEKIELGEVALVLASAAPISAPVPAPKPAASTANPTSSASTTSAAQPAPPGKTAPAPAANAEAEPLVGKEIGGYRLLSLLGRGGMGTVYRALQMSLDREVALKLLSPELCAEPGFVEQFQREARAAGQLNHPNIVQVYDVGQEGPHHFYSMELIPHGSLETKLKRDGKLPWRDALLAARDAAHGLEYAESKRIVHRDIKPDNLMLGERGVVKIADLGLAGRHEEDAQERGVLGTPHFMSPEQAQGQPVDGRGDIYSLGATLYRILSGRNPFSGRTVKEIVRAQIQDQPTPLRELVSDVPPRVAALIERMMQKDPAQRFASAADLVTEIEAALGGEEAPAKRGGRGVLVAALLALVGGGAWVAFGGGAEKQDGERARVSDASATGNGSSAASSPAGTNAANPGGAGTQPENPSSTEPSQTELEMQRQLRETQAQLARNTAEALNGTRAERIAAWRKVVADFGGTAAARQAAEQLRTLEAEQAALASAIAAVQQGDPAALERREWTTALRATLAPIAGLVENLRKDAELLAASEAAANAVAQRAEQTTTQALAAIAAPSQLAELDAARAQLAQLGREVLLDESVRAALPAAIGARFAALQAAIEARRTALETEAKALGAARRDAERLALWRALSSAAESALAHDYSASEKALETCGAALTESDHTLLCQARSSELALAAEGVRALAAYFGSAERKPLQIEHPDGKGKVFVAKLTEEQLFVQKKRDEEAQALPLAAIDTTAELLALCEPALALGGESSAALAALLALETSARGAELAREAIGAVLRGEEQGGRNANEWFQAGFEAAQRALESAGSSAVAKQARALLERERDAAIELSDALRALAEGRYAAADGSLARLAENGKGSWLFARLTEGRGALGEAAR
ncbi:MAG: protein kinase [Planctomycetes bacterium]|nr:protein kinase [Planctomycetota bacterium]